MNGSRNACTKQVLLFPLFVIALTLVLILTAARSSSASKFDAKLYGQLLAQYAHATSTIAGTVVDYEGLGREPRWKVLIENLGQTQPEALKTRNQKLAYWINAYNILTIDLVVQHYPVKSIRDIGKLWSPVWNRKAGVISGKSYTLSQIEHKILQPLADPRIHAAIVCASQSCPSLSREPWQAKGIDAQLDRAATRWLADTQKGLRIEPKRNRLVLSKIFQWFEADFESMGGVRSFIARYSPPEVQSFLKGKGSTAKIRYFDYDWQLNDRRAVNGRQMAKR